MTLQDKVRARYMALARNYNRKAIGIVVDRDTYIALRREAPWESDFVLAEHNYSDNNGDTYMGLDVAITKKPNTLIVY